MERGNAAVVREIIAHPYVRTWAERGLRDAVGLAPPSDSSHLASIAAAAAIRSGTTAELDVPVIDGHIQLPTLGRLWVGSARTATVATDGTGFAVRAVPRRWRVELADSAPAQDWAPVRELRAGRLTVRLEDTDPYRDCYRLSVAPRLSHAEAARWQDQLTVAWNLVERDYPRYAPALAAGLSTLTPLVNGVSSREISAAARSAFGAVGIARPADGETLALLLIHEFQHVKLGAVLDLFDLCMPLPDRLFHAPWRDDPRPIEALLQGTYAHLTVTDYWRVRRRRGGAAGLEAAARFGRLRAWTATAIETLAGSGALTPLGTRFIDGMRATLAPWLEEPLAGVVRPCLAQPTLPATCRISAFTRDKRS